MEFKKRLKTARLEKGFSQVELAKLVGIHLTNISRYERGENKPTTEVLSKLADTLNITTDYLMGGTINEKASSSIADKELLSQFQKVEALPSEKRIIFKEVIDALLIKTELQIKFAH